MSSTGTVAVPVSPSTWSTVARTKPTRGEVDPPLATWLHATSTRSARPTSPVAIPRTRIGGRRPSRAGPRPSARRDASVPCSTRWVPRPSLVRRFVAFAPYGRVGVNARRNRRDQREIANFGEAGGAPDTDNTGRMGSAGSQEHPSPALDELLVHANDRSRPSADRRVVAELRSRRGVAGDFVVPAGRNGWRALLAYNRLRPARVRFGRAALGLTIAAGLGPVVTERRTITARPGDRVLLDYLSRALGEPQLRIAGTDRPCRDFVTPVLQLFTDDGRCVGFAKIGWDPVTRRMIDDEVEALRRVRAAGPTGVRVPAVLWHG